ncbi:MAG: hypothetical protein ACMUIP_07405 [bacterium]
MRNSKLFMVVLICLIAGFIISSTVSAQYWQAMPPYNILWPLWSDVLSPNVSGVPTPLVSSLTSTTQLPVMPAFVWDIGPYNIYGHPYFLYNAPASLGGGLFYYDQLTGFNTFPPSEYLLPGGGLYVNPLPAGYEYLIPGIGFNNFDWHTVLANNAYIAYFAYVPDALSYYDLLPGDELWGSPPSLFPDVLLW